MKTIILFLCIISFGCSSVNKSITNVAENPKDISPLLIGEILPKTTLQDVEGNSILLENVIKEKPSVLVFYRGSWCPYCNLQLASLASVEKQILELGYQIVAISPDDYQNLKNTEEKDSINYKLYSDKDGKFIQEIGIAFQTPLLVKGFVSTKKHEGKMSDIIPVPTVMIVNQDRVIQFEYINPNYKERLNSEMLLAVLKTLKNQ